MPSMIPPKSMLSPIRPRKDGDARAKGKPFGSVREHNPVAEPEQNSVWSYIKECIAVSPIGNLCIVSALIIGFYHGWLKRTYPGALAVFAYDIPLVIGLAFAFKSLPARQSLLSNSRTVIALKFVLFLCILYTLIPTDVPWLIRLASLRGWIFIPLMFIVGYRIMTVPSQLFLFSVLILVLCVSVSIYGAFQDPADFLNIESEDAGLMRTINGSTYSREDGVAGFRVFSSFVAPGAFAATMVFGIIIGAGYATQPMLDYRRRLLWVGGIGMSLYGVFISGSRSSMVTAALGIVVIIWMRGILFKMILLLGALTVVGPQFLEDSKSIDVGRLQTAFSVYELFGRVWIVVEPTFFSLLESPLGGGLGRSTHGVPIILSYLVSRYKPTLIDGEMGHAAADLGLVGLVVYFGMIIRAVQDSMFWAKSLKGSPSESDAIITAALWVVTVPSFVTGAPFLHVPTGAILWCYLGALNRIYDERFGGKRNDRYQNLKMRPRSLNDENPVPPLLSPAGLKSSSSSCKASESPKTSASRKFLYRK